MTYRACITYLFNFLPMYQRIGKAAYKSNLNNSMLLDDYFHHPHKKYRCIHIAGTNGKGSVSHMLAAILQISGYKVGLYTSPHLNDFRERIKINGKKIPKNHVIKFMKKHKKIIEKLAPSFFEITVAMAFDFFANRKIDIAVIETGMGGRLDSTNIITPIITIITNISKDHTEFLGKTLKDIATEKAGIIKPNVPVIIGETDKQTKPVFIKLANINKCHIDFADDHFMIQGKEYTPKNKLILNYKNKHNSKTFKINLDVSGLYQIKNTRTTLMAVEKLKQTGLNIQEKNIYKGFQSFRKITGLQGRWQIIGHKPLIIIDIAHNESGIQSVSAQLQKLPHNKLHIVFGMVADKDTDAILDLMPEKATYYFCRANIPRALDEGLLAKKAAIKGLKGNTYNSVSEAYKSAQLAAKNNDVIFIGGSTFIVAEALKK